MSAAGGGECAKRADRGQDDVGPAGPVGEVQDRAAAVAGEEGLAGGLDTKDLCHDAGGNAALAAFDMLNIEI